MSDEVEGTTEEVEGIRLQKVLSAAGIASRRNAEIMIDEGRVEVNGKIVMEQGRRVDPERDVIRVDGSRIPAARRHVYLVLNKPRGVVSTMDDPEGRPTIRDYLRRRESLGLFHVGRLDTDTEGLLLLTNDGEFANRMTHPSYEVPKSYLAEVAGDLDNNELKWLTRGVRLEDGVVRPDKVKLIQRGGDKTLLTVIIHEGRNRIVRRMFDAIGHPVRRLSRTSIGPVRVGTLAVGEIRELSRDELGTLLDMVKM
ncbi:MAG: pseudouridine synthase [Propionibacteriaceae bacterium]|nr:rRNA pseudouridine synthase [Micropruina sp.]HBX82012.1 MFS transporter [Propionibacteriaceae bacterium]HBY24183.1 MFS transporter [Propionibacteriaceae bacterium]